MTILTRYLLRSHAGPFLFALSVLTGLLFVNTVARRIKDLAGKGLDLSVIGKVLMLSLPHIVALTLPMAVLVSVLYTFSQLSADNEVTALKASGANLVRLILPLVAAGVMLAGVMVWFNDRVLPNANHELKNLLMDVSRKSPTFQLKAQVINEVRAQTGSTRYFLQPARIDHGTGRMWDVVIYDLSLGQRARTVYADSGTMAFNEKQTDLLLTLYDGWVHEAETYETQKFQRARFTDYLMVLRGIGDEFTRVREAYRGDREMSIGMLKAQADSAQQVLAGYQRDAERQAELAVRRALAGPTRLPEDSAVLSRSALAGGYLADLPIETRARAFQVEGNDEVAHRAAIELQVLRGQAENQLRIANMAWVEYHKKFAIPFACIVFVLLGAPIAVRFPRGGAGMVIAISLAVFGIYYMSLIGGEALGDRGQVPPFLGPWGPNIVFFFFAILGLTRIGRETSTTRGGGWDDLWLTIRGVLTRPLQRRPRPAAESV
jgi:lipopolysaccharide export system permease protein